MFLVSRVEDDKGLKIYGIFNNKEDACDTCKLVIKNEHGIDCELTLFSSLKDEYEKYIKDSIEKFGLNGTENYT